MLYEKNEIGNGVCEQQWYQSKISVSLQEDHNDNIQKETSVVFLYPSEQATTTGSSTKIS